MNQREKLQKLLDLQEEKILHLRIAKVTQTDPSVTFKVKTDIEEAEAERDKIKQEIENKNISNTSCDLNHALLKLGYREQVLSFKKFL